jgi:hypothetical protein
VIASMSNRYFTFWRQTAYAMDATTAAAAMTLTRTAPSGCYIQITVLGGTTGSGTVTITGTDTGGAAASETLTFTANGSQVTVAKWGTVTSISTTGLASEASVPTVAAKSVSSDGTPSLIRYSVAASRPMMESPQGSPSYKAPTPGTVESDKAVFVLDFESAWTPRADDIAIDDSTAEEWLVRGVRDVRVGFGIRTAHYSLVCSRSQT